MYTKGPEAAPWNGKENRMKISSVVVSTLMFMALWLRVAAAADLQVADAVVARSIIDRVPVGVAESFPADVGKVWCYTRIKGAEGPTTISHRWYYGERLMAEVPLEVRSALFRTYSSKRILPSWKGEWRVDVVSEDGTVLKTVRFRIE